MGDDRNRASRPGEDFLCRIADIISEAYPDTGFALLVFPFGDRGAINYISNAQPTDMAEQLRSMADRLESEGVSPGVSSADHQHTTERRPH
jgi:hypothetical protein